MPLSRTRTTACSSCRSTEIEIRPPSSVYFALLFRRFKMTCDRRVGSATTTTVSGGRETSR